MGTSGIADALADLALRIGSAVVAHPESLIPVVVGCAVLIILVSPVSGSSPNRDPRRTFTSDERQRAFARAGWRCEHKNPLWMRCTNTPSQGDHIYPWSRGGRTAMSNHQALCAFHNNRKSGHVPSRLYVMALQMRRRRYFPEGESVLVEWREGAAR